MNNQSAFVANGTSPFESDRDSVIFIHGAGQDHSIWLMPSRYFMRHGYNVLSPDLPGHGRSEPPALSTIEAMAQWVVNVLDAAGISQAAFVGHSMGSLVALAAAALHADRVRALALIGTAAPMRVTSALLERAEANHPAAIDMLTLWGHSRAAHLKGNPAPGMWMLSGGRQLLQQSSPGVIHADLQACDRYAVGIDHAARVTCPTLVILGERDSMTPCRAASELCSTLRNAKTLVLERAGHALLAERPDEILDALIEVV